MKIPDFIIDNESIDVQMLFYGFRQIMEENVKFWDIPGDLDIHTKGHCERVLLHALRIADARHDTMHVKLALAHASIFHDTRRKDNYLDQGHGSRAASYYKEFCDGHPVDSNDDNPSAEVLSGDRVELPFLPDAFAAIWYHDRDDAEGEQFIRETAPADEVDSWLEVYHVFKDADALDRLRLGTWCLDPKYLRTKEAKGMREYAQQLVEATIPADELQRTYKATEPFRKPRP